MLQGVQTVANESDVINGRPSILINIRWTDDASGKYCDKEIKAKPTLTDRKWPGNVEVVICYHMFKLKKYSTITLSMWQNTVL
jgi:hypothetical protein